LLPATVCYYFESFDAFVASAGTQPRGKCLLSLNR